MKTFQPMPDLAPEQYDALRQEIEANGVIVPIVVDQHGRILDGHNRRRIADELGIEPPVEVRHVKDDDEAADIAVALNCARRHLSREQVREVVAHEIHRRPGESDRAIARRVGCSPSTVGAVRRSGGDVVSTNVDTAMASREEAEQRTEEIRAAVHDARAALYALVGMALANHISVHEVVGALTMAKLKCLQRVGISDEARDLFVEWVYDYVIEMTTWDETREQFPPHPDSDPTPEERAELIDNIVMMGAARHPADSMRTDDA